MTSICTRCALLAMTATIMGASMTTPAAEWKPGKPVEFVVPAPAGGTLDRPARVVQKIWQEAKLVDVPVNTVNKSAEWKRIVAQEQWVDEYVSSADARKHIDQEYAEMREILTDLGMAKQP